MMVIGGIGLIGAIGVVDGPAVCVTALAGRVECAGFADELSADRPRPTPMTAGPRIASVNLVMLDSIGDAREPWRRPWKYFMQYMVKFVVNVCIYCT
jgi:hypothetical protein